MEKVKPKINPKINSLQRKINLNKKNVFMFINKHFLQIHNKEMAYRGGAATWRRCIRFKHLATDQYLTIVPLSLNPNFNDRRTANILKYTLN